MLLVSNRMVYIHGYREDWRRIGSSGRESRAVLRCIGIRRRNSCQIWENVRSTGILQGRTEPPPETPHADATSKGKVFWAAMSGRTHLVRQNIPALFHADEPIRPGALALQRPNASSLAGKERILWSKSAIDWSETTVTLSQSTSAGRGVGSLLKVSPRALS